MILMWTCVASARKFIVTNAIQLYIVICVAINRAEAVVWWIITVQAVM